MPTTNLNIGRFSVVSRNSFQDVLAAIEDQVGHPDMQKFVADVAAAKTDDELNEIVRTAVGPTDLMECMRLDQGAVLRLRRVIAKDTAGPAARCSSGSARATSPAS